MTTSWSLITWKASLASLLNFFNDQYIWYEPSGVMHVLGMNHDQKLLFRLRNRNAPNFHYWGLGFDFRSRSKYHVIGKLTSKQVSTCLSLLERIIPNNLTETNWKYYHCIERCFGGCDL